MNNIFSSKKLYLLFILFTTTSCSNSTINNSESLFEIEQLKLSHKRPDGTKYMSLNSVKANYSEFNDQIITFNPSAIIYKNENPYYFINSLKVKTTIPNKRGNIYLKKLEDIDLTI